MAERHCTDCIAAPLAWVLTYLPAIRVWLGSAQGKRQ